MYHNIATYSGERIQNDNENLIFNNESMTTDKSPSNDIVAKKVIFTDRETIRCSVNNKQYIEKRNHCLTKLLLSI